MFLCTRNFLILLTMLYNVAQFILLVNKQIPYLHNSVLYLLIVVAVWYDKNYVNPKKREGLCSRQRLTETALTNTAGE